MDTAQLLLTTLGIAIVAFMVLAVLSGAWFGTWCGSGRHENDPGFPGAKPPL
ncbi:MAG: hypothetical protein HZB46_06200 [Solirubrobacterales bacterium]|nr:hypothetical protein [Solirubrobacterales bacterium]